MPELKIGNSVLSTKVTMSKCLTNIKSDYLFDALCLLKRRGDFFYLTTG